jgi:hypothetical protein
MEDFLHDYNDFISNFSESIIEEYRQQKKMKETMDIIMSLPVHDCDTKKYIARCDNIVMRRTEEATAKPMPENYPVLEFAEKIRKGNGNVK